jgi:hypothetical protein
VKTVAFSKPAHRVAGATGARSVPRLEPGNEGQRGAYGEPIFSDCEPARDYCEPISSRWEPISSRWELISSHWEHISSHWELISSHWELISSHWEEFSSHWDEISSHWEEISSRWERFVFSSFPGSSLGMPCLCNSKPYSVGWMKMEASEDSWLELF